MVQDILYTYGAGTRIILLGIYQNVLLNKHEVWSFLFVKTGQICIC